MDKRSIFHCFAPDRTRSCVHADVRGHLGVVFEFVVHGGFASRSNLFWLSMCLVYATAILNGLNEGRSISLFFT